MEYLDTRNRNNMVNQLLATTSIPYLKALVQLLDEEPYPHEFVCKWIDANIPQADVIFGWHDESVNSGSKQ